MSIDQAILHAANGDTVTLSLWEHSGGTALMLTVTDADATPVPTAELTISEAQELREIMRGMLERHSRRHGLRL